MEVLDFRECSTSTVHVAASYLLHYCKILIIPLSRVVLLKM